PVRTDPSRRAPRPAGRARAPPRRGRGAPGRPRGRHFREAAWRRGRVLRSSRRGPALPGRRRAGAGGWRGACRGHGKGPSPDGPMLPTLLVLVSIALVISLAFHLFGRSAPTARAPGAATAPGTAPAGRSGPDPELERRRREVDELKTTVAELRGELKQTRKKLHDQRTSDKEGADLVKARAEVERTASQQLEVVRSELASALTEVGRLKSETEAFRMRRPAPAPAPAHAPPAPVAPPPAPEPRRFRELSDTDREKMERLAHLAHR